MIDLHCHLLAGLDDGPASLEESLELARIAVADGITHAVVTPHIHPGRWDNHVKLISRACRDLQTALDRASIPLSLGFAAEVRFGEHILPAIGGHTIPFYGTMQGQQVMLLEFPHGHVPPGSEQLVRWLRDRDIQPLIAHPERNREIMRSPDRVLGFLRQGCLLQLTAGSILGRFGERAMEVAHHLLDQDMVYVVASDGHNDGPRPPQMQAAYERVAERFDRARAERLFRLNPLAVAGTQFPGLV